MLSRRWLLRLLLLQRKRPKALKKRRSKLRRLTENLLQRANLAHLVVHLVVQNGRKKRKESPILRKKGREKSLGDSKKKLWKLLKRKLRCLRNQ